MTYTQPLELQYSENEVKPVPDSLLPHYTAKPRENGVFCKKTHKRHTKSQDFFRMRPPSEPAISRNNPDKYFIYWNHDVPFPLWDKYYPRKRIRIIVKDNINRYTGQEREDYAEARLQVWKYSLTKLNYNPFEEQLAELDEIKRDQAPMVEEIQIIEEKVARREELSEEEKRKLTGIPDAFNKFMDSRRKRKLEKESISSYQGCIDWIYEGLAASGYDHFKISELKHIHLSEALNYIADDRDWNATTINKGVEFMMTVFNWLETEEYIIKNPSKGKFEKLPTNKNKHRWYDRDLMQKVVEAIEDNKPLLRACQFTYWLMIRSKKELRKLKVGDIDRTLKRIRFTAELSKNKNEAYRDYPDDFEQILKEMRLEKYPRHFFVFGEGNGTPSIKQCGHNYFSKMFMAVKNKLGLSMDYTIYGFKHTRIVHELMKGTDGYKISHMARHNDKKSTQDYMRDYDITLVNKYGPDDLKFYQVKD